MNFTPAPAAPAAADDATLVARYVAGDDAAFTTLLLRHQGRVFTTALLVVRDRALAEDLTQETFIKVIRKLQAGEYTEGGKFAGWVCRIAHNLGLDALRRQKRHNALSLDVEPATGKGKLPSLAATLRCPEPTPETLLQRQDANEVLRRYIEDLPAPQKQVLLMRHYGQMSFQEIAAATDVSINTAVARMRYALQNLRRRMAPASSGASLLLATLLAMPPITNPLTFTSPPTEDCHDQNFYPRDADPVRL